MEANLFEITQKQLDLAAKKLGLDEIIHAMLREPMRELQVNFPVKMDDGRSKIFRGFRVQYNDARGPTQGGLRFHPDETMDTVKALAAWMTWKTAVMDLPLGGASGAVICNPKEMSAGELERLSRAFVRAVGRLLGATRDIPAPDVYTNSQTMSWMLDEYEAVREEKSPDAIAGKPLALGGSLGRQDAAARGGVYAVREACKITRLDPKEGTYAVQGFGNAGRFAALLHAEILGGKLIAASDSLGGIYRAEGMDPRKLIEHKQRTGKLSGFPGSEPISNIDLLELPVDVLYPAALDNVIHEENAGRIKARILCELADGPTAPEADKILQKNKAFVIPDLLANAGSVTVGYFEQVQNAGHDFWPLEEIHYRLEARIVRAFQEVTAMQERHNVTMRIAAYMVAVSRVAEAMRLRGWI